jgi:hypothetical protein
LGAVASGIYAGQKHKLVVRVSGPRTDVWVATGALPASPVLSASHVDFQTQGWPQLGAQAGGNVGSGLVVLDDFKVSRVATAPDAAAREWFRFESHPGARVIQSNASVFSYDRTGDFTGQPPQVPAVGSPGATGPGRFVVMSGEIDNFVGNDLLDVRLDVLERFSFFQ